MSADFTDIALAFFGGVATTGFTLTWLFSRWYNNLHRALMDISYSHTIWEDVAVRSLGRFAAKRAYKHAKEDDMYLLDDIIWTSVSAHVRNGEVDCD